MATPARQAAFDILLRVEQRQAYAGELLHSDLLRDLSHADRSLCTELVMGTLRWRSRLDFGIGAVSSQPLGKLDPEVLTALRLGAYQIGFLRLPARAAVNESVELVKRARRRYSVPFANAVLRKLAAKPELVGAPPKPAVGLGGNTIADLAQLYAHPLWLVERWAAAFGLAATEAICAFDQQAPPIALRLVGPSVQEDLRREGVQLMPGALLKSAWRAVKGAVTHTGAFGEGRVFVQDEASQLVALLLGHGSRFLDCCAAPGGKTAILAGQNPEAMIVATDLHPHRAALLHRRLQRHHNVRVLASDAAALPLTGDFDRVLADVSCSGTGTLSRNPEIKWRLQPEDLPDLHRRQVAILRAALERVRAGGRLLYSTCSLEREENVDVVDEVLAAQSGASRFRVLPCREQLERLRHSGDLVWQDIDALLDGPFLRTLPGLQPCDGFFAAMIERE